MKLRSMSGLSKLVFLAFFATQTLPLSNLNACTTFCFADRGLSVVGKSYDWGLGHGMVVHNKRNVQKQSVTPAKANIPFSWVSKYSSVSFNQFGIEFPLGGMNEKGLNVEIMWLTSSIYPTSADDRRTAVNELQWIQYVLDSSADTAEAVKNAQKIRVSPLVAKVHYLVCDRNSRCATFEYINKQLTVRNGDWLALTNNTMDDSNKYLKTFLGFGGSNAIPFDETASLDRFVLANYGVAHWRNQKTATEYAFEVLKSVQTEGWSKWQIVYDQSLERISFATADQPTIKFFDTAGLNPSCLSPSKTIDMNASFKSKDITSEFVVLTKNFNDAMIDQNTFVAKKWLDLAKDYPATTKCME
jgi:penicillin V acylase-like amidase (Ntn superfamily)